MKSCSPVDSAWSPEVSSLKITPEIILNMKREGRRVPALTAYDYSMARLLDECGIPLILVGDSLGMLVLGYPDTTSVTLADMEHHVKATARAKPKALLVADLPIGSYSDPESAVRSALRIVNAGAEAVKAEGGLSIIQQVKAIQQAGIPFMGHLGMLPQHIREEGRYRIKGRNEEERKALINDALALTEAGAFAIVLELVSPETAAEITSRVPVPTIGIGSGTQCDGQILVTQDLIGAFPWFTPKHISPRIQSAQEIQGAVRQWMEDLPGV
jgi:3-methyl-2-oxobutanoate hydroxymethyltransferase